VAKTVAKRLAADDGETVGALWRPSGGFEVSSGWETVRVPNADHAFAAETAPADPAEPWLLPVGESEVVPWPRGRPGWLREFAALHTRPDQSIAGFASRHGWLRQGVLVRRLSDGTEACADRMHLWREESERVDELLGLLEAAGSPKVEANRLRIVHHFTREGGVAPVVDGGPLPEELPIREDQSGRVIGIGSFPPRRAPLMRMERGRLSVVARKAVEIAVDLALREDTTGCLAERGIRVKPTSLLGAVYLGVAALLLGPSRPKLCQACHEEFIPTRKDQLYCHQPGKDCKSAWYRAKRERDATHREDMT
jgi:hypothetical protein